MRDEKSMESFASAALSLFMIDWSQPARQSLAGAGIVIPSLGTLPCEQQHVFPDKAASDSTVVWKMLVVLRHRHAPRTCIDVARWFARERRVAWRAVRRVVSIKYKMSKLAFSHEYVKCTKCARVLSVRDVQDYIECKNVHLYFRCLKCA